MFSPLKRDHKHIKEIKPAPKEYVWCSTVAERILKSTGLIRAEKAGTAV